MAELAAAASIVQIGDVGLRLGIKLLAFAETVASADKAIMLTSTDITLTSSVLKEVGEVIQKDQTFRTYSLGAIGTATALATECSEVFLEMEKILITKFPNISSTREDKISRATVILERFKWPYWRPKLHLLGVNLAKFKCNLLIILNVIIYQRLSSSESVQVHARQTTLIRDLIDSKEKHIRKYEKLKRNIVEAKPNSWSPSNSDDFSAPFRAHAIKNRRNSLSQAPEHREGLQSIADLNSEKETQLNYINHLMSLFDRLIIEVDTPAYQIGRISRYRIRSHIYQARSNEFSQLNHLHGRANIKQAWKMLKLNSSDYAMLADCQEGRREHRERSADVRSPYPVASSIEGFHTRSDFGREYPQTENPEGTKVVQQLNVLSPVYLNEIGDVPRRDYNATTSRQSELARQRPYIDQACEICCILKKKCDEIKPRCGLGNNVNCNYPVNTSEHGEIKEASQDIEGGLGKTLIYECADRCQQAVPSEAEYTGDMILGASMYSDTNSTSFFPPTAGHFPDYLPTVRSRNQHEPEFSTSQPTIALPKHGSLPMRRKTSKTKRTGKSRSRSLKTMQQHQRSLDSLPKGSQKGPRKGRLDPTASAASRKRSNRPGGASSSRKVVDQPMRVTTDVSHTPSEQATKDSLEYDSQRQLENLLALWTPLPVGEKHFSKDY